jgi:hypothetical protein
MGPSQLHARQREGAHREYPCVDSVACCPVRGHAWFCVRWVLVLSGALQARMDHGVLGHLVTDCPLRTGPTVGAGLLAGCMQRVGSSTCYNILKTR